MSAYVHNQEIHKKLPSDLPFVQKGTIFLIKKTIPAYVRWEEFGILDDNFLIFIEYNKTYYKLFSSQTNKIIIWHISLINFFYYFEPLKT